MIEETKTYQQWCVENDSTHGHCPLDCEHPQPYWDGKNLVCGQCAVEGILSLIVPCTPEVCEILEAAAK